MKQLFLGIRVIPDDKMLSTYWAIRESLNYNSIRWVDPDKFHITIKFFGHTSDDNISIVNSVIVDIIKSKCSFNIELVKTGVFGSSYNPRVIWFGIHNNIVLQELTMELHEKLDDAGIKKDRQNFVPHITIGRIKKIVDKKLFNLEINKYCNTFLQNTLVDKIFLFESIMLAKGTEYKVINEYSLLPN